jgi:hypothetical protein
MHSTTPVQINPSTRHRAVSLRSSIVNVEPCTNQPFSENGAQNHGHAKPSVAIIGKEKRAAAQ